ncbi:8641_t:CDS:2 [Dentiscutata erythropus]|uniref:8641_t:CDS:1 n=1 Tax=Dentiscutata erythropus TaxID=1348616 RepID=A0A9N8VZP9_9GLOM|nr:8641_t:CDS:2 [Dentiscutata erythropus]
MTRIYTLRQKILIYPGKVRCPHLNTHKQAKLANNLPINNNLKNNEGVSINTNFENSHKGDDFKDLPIDNDSLKYNNIDSNLKDISNNNSSDDLEDMLINNAELEESNDNFEDSNNDLEDTLINNIELEDSNDFENFKYTIGQFVEFINTNSKNQHERQFRRIEATISFLPPFNSEYPNDQMQDALKISRLLKYNELGIHCSQIEAIENTKSSG